MRARLRRRRGGQAMVEFIIVFPLLMLLVLGVYEFGRAWNIYQVMTDAAREGARTAVVDNTSITQDSVYFLVNAALWRARIDTTAAVKTMPDGFHTGIGLPTTVTIRYTHRFRLVGGLLRWTTGQSTFQITTSSTMRNE